MRLLVVLHTRIIPCWYLLHSLRGDVCKRYRLRFTYDSIDIVFFSFQFDTYAQDSPFPMLIGANFQSLLY